jgi:hypothetical protein
MTTNDAKIQGNRLESKMCNDYVNNPECLACRGRTCCIESNCNARTWHWSERAHVRYKTKPTRAARGYANTLKTKQLCKKSKGRWYIKKMYTKILRVRHYVPNARYTWNFETWQVLQGIWS